MEFYSQKVPPHLSSHTTFLMVWNSNSKLISSSKVFLLRRHYQNRQHMVWKGGPGDLGGVGSIEFGEIYIKQVSYAGGPQNLWPFPHNSDMDEKLPDRMILFSAFTHSLVKASFPRIYCLSVNGHYIAMNKKDKCLWYYDTFKGEGNKEQMMKMFRLDSDLQGKVKVDKGILGQGRYFW